MFDILVAPQDEKLFVSVNARGAQKTKCMTYSISPFRLNPHASSLARNILPPSQEMTTHSPFLSATCKSISYTAPQHTIYSFLHRKSHISICTHDRHISPLPRSFHFTTHEVCNALIGYQPFDMGTKKDFHDSEIDTFRSREVNTSISYLNQHIINHPPLGLTHQLRNDNSYFNYSSSMVKKVQHADFTADEIQSRRTSESPVRCSGSVFTQNRKRKANHPRRPYSTSIKYISGKEPTNLTSPTTNPFKSYQFWHQHIIPPTKPTFQVPKLSHKPQPPPPSRSSSSPPSIPRLRRRIQANISGFSNRRFSISR